MKRLFISFTLFLTLFFINSLYAAEVYNIDPQHTFIVWKISHFGFSMQTGKFTMVSGSITLDETKPQNSKVSVTIPMNEVHTGIPKLDEHLLTEDFFDTKKYPTATFVSDKIQLTGKDKANIYGTLTLHGVSKPVVLHAMLLKKGLNPMKNKTSIGLSATTELKRSDFGMTGHLPSLGDNVKIDIGLEATLAN